MTRGPCATQCAGGTEWPREQRIAQTLGMLRATTPTATEHGLYERCPLLGVQQLYVLPRTGLSRRPHRMMSALPETAIRCSEAWYYWVKYQSCREEVPAEHTSLLMRYMDAGCDDDARTDECTVLRERPD